MEEFESLLHLKHSAKSGKLASIDRRGKHIELHFKFAGPASESELRGLSQKLQISEEHAHLLRFSNGFEIYNFDGLDGFKILSIDELLRINPKVRESYGDEWKATDETVIGVECIGDGTYLGFRKDENGKAKVLDVFLENLPHEWMVIAPTIESFFAKLTENKGEKFWLKAPAARPQPRAPA